MPLMIDIMSGVLTGAGFGPCARNLYEDFENPQNVGAFFHLVDVESFMPAGEFKSRVDRMIDEVKAVRRVRGVEEIFVPGEIEHHIEQNRLASGIPLGAETVAELAEVGRLCGVELDDFIYES
jgi:LDH2 family malate/lactate/ureidoglycolate dehydrogenase